MFKERIEYDNPNTLEEAMRKANFCYDKNTNKRENMPSWKNKRPNNYDPKKKQNKFHNNSWNKYRGYQGNKYKKL